MSDPNTEGVAAAFAPADDPNAPEGPLVAVTTAGTVEVDRDAPMPPSEPGHKGAEINGGETPFDPNAARRFAEGRGPGMQDSERFQPAHWQQPQVGAGRDPAAYVAGLEQELEYAKTRAARPDADDRDSSRVGEIEAELSKAQADLEAALTAEVDAVKADADRQVEAARKRAGLDAPKPTGRRRSTTETPAS